MSWDSYIQDQLLATKCIKHAIICGHDGNIWAQSKEITVISIILFPRYLNTNGLIINVIITLGR